MQRARGGCRWGGGLVLFGLLLAPTTSRAAEPTKTELAAARDLFARAERDEDGGRWGDALDKLRRASSVKMTPGIRFHIALCEENLGQLVAAPRETRKSSRSSPIRSPRSAYVSPTSRSCLRPTPRTSR
jgi:hypothetical protein